MSEPKFDIYLDDLYCIAHEVPVDFVGMIVEATIQKFWEECVRGDLSIKIDAHEYEVISNED